ncbi:Reverse transcriptase Ty1/copia-type domain-containing protein [Mycena venus]|uniref:Reverse transcriptase Ty1/copia-type domain-containing protein n=1 Tax=Mycena venus TaxID=2733690 RepID=A0A8H7DI42_9AGAR|nr:Reverse transcriptase Ty1/copia-type domain-containing protein [Mycena venus]
MVGYNKTASYQLWEALARRLICSCDVVFEEGVGHWLHTTAGGVLEDAVEAPINLHAPVVPNPDVIVTDETDAGRSTPKLESAVVQPRRSGRTRNPSKALQDSLASQTEEAAARDVGEDWATSTKQPARAVSAFTASTMKRSNTMLIGREVWVLVDPPINVNVVDSKWVYAVKYDTEGEVIKWKAQLVAKGFQQIAGVDFFETYAGVVHYESLKLLGAICVNEPGWVMWAMDVMSVYLNSEMKETVYMRQPEDFVVPGQEGKVCLMKKSLYGFMQSGRNWAEHLNASLGALGWVRSRADPAIRIRSSDAGTSIIGVYTDDIDGISSSTAAAEEAQAGIRSAYDVTDVPRTATSLGMTIDASLSTMAWLTAIRNPPPLPVGAQVLATKEPLTDAERDFMEDKPYHEAVGSIQHAANITRPDFAYAVGTLATCVSNPHPEHWKAVQHLLAYIKGTLDYKIIYKRGTGSGIKPVGWADSNYAADLATRCSTSGEIFMMSGGPVSWSSKRQAMVALSTVEAEYVALTRSTNQAMWMYSFLAELSMPQERPAILHCDNTGAEALAKGHKGPRMRQAYRHLQALYLFSLVILTSPSGADAHGIALIVDRLPIVDLALAAAQAPVPDSENIGELAPPFYRGIPICE